MDDDANDTMIGSTSSMGGWPSSSGNGGSSFLSSCRALQKSWHIRGSPNWRKLCWNCSRASSAQHLRRNLRASATLMMHSTAWCRPAPVVVVQGRSSEVFDKPSCDGFVRRPSSIIQLGQPHVIVHCVWRMVFFEPFSNCPLLAHGLGQQACVGI